LFRFVVVAVRTRALNGEHMTRIYLQLSFALVRLLLQEALTSLVPLSAAAAAIAADATCSPLADRYLAAKFAACDDMLADAGVIVLCVFIVCVLLMPISSLFIALRRVWFAPASKLNHFDDDDDDDGGVDEEAAPLRGADAAAAATATAVVDVADVDVDVRDGVVDGDIDIADDGGTRNAGIYEVHSSVAGDALAPDNDNRNGIGGGDGNGGDDGGGGSGGVGGGETWQPSPKPLPAVARPSPLRLIRRRSQEKDQHNPLLSASAAAAAAAANSVRGAGNYDEVEGDGGANDTFHVAASLRRGADNRSDVELMTQRFCEGLEEVPADVEGGGDGDGDVEGDGNDDEPEI
jgi:hypothetical protein